MTKSKKFKNIFFKNKKFYENLALLIIVAFIILGFFFNYKLSNSVNSKTNITSVSAKEKEFILTLGNENNPGGIELEEKMLEKLEETNSLANSPQKNDTLARINYILGLNKYIIDDNDKAIEYFKKSLTYFDNSSTYFYILRIHNSLMNIYLNRNDQISALSHANEIYSILKRPDLHDLDENDQNALRINILCGIVTTTSGFEMNEMAKRFYNELIEITDANPDINSNLPIYAKYQYNLNIGNYEEAIKFAEEYIKYFEENIPNQVNGAYIYLLEAKIYSKDLEGVEEIIARVEKEYEKIDDPLYTATLEKLKGYYYDVQDNYELAVEHMNRAINLYNSLDMVDYSIDINNKIILLNNRLNISSSENVDLAIKFNNLYNQSKEIGKLADSLVEVSLKQTDEENSRMKEETLLIENIANISKKLNLIYIVIILLLLLIAFLFKNEISKRREKENELNNMIKIDYLTKAFSRKYTISKIEDNINSSSDFSLILFDIDNFKNVNDTYGHSVGDEVLIKIVNSTKNILRENDMIGRFGGEEFIVLLDNSEDNKALAEKIRKNIEDIKFDFPDLKVTISGGLVNWTDQTSSKLVSEADVLLYEAKNSGKNKILS